MELAQLDEKGVIAITEACDEINEGKLDDNFPLVVWQIGKKINENKDLIKNYLKIYKFLETFILAKIIGYYIGILKIIDWKLTQSKERDKKRMMNKLCLL